MKAVLLLFCPVLFNFIDVVFQKSSFTCCDKYSTYYECDNCRSILFFVEKDATVKLRSSRTYMVEVKCGSIQKLFVATVWQYKHLCSSHISVCNWQ